MPESFELSWEEKELIALDQAHHQEKLNLQERQTKERKDLAKKVATIKRKRRQDLWRAYLLHQLPLLAIKVSNAHARGQALAKVKTTSGMPYLGKTTTRLIWEDPFERDTLILEFLDYKTKTGHPATYPRAIVLKCRERSTPLGEWILNLRDEARKGKLPSCPIWHKLPDLRRAARNGPKER